MPITGEALQKLNEGSTLVLEGPKSGAAPPAEMPTAAQTFGDQTVSSGKYITNQFAQGFWDMANMMAKGGAYLQGRYEDADRIGKTGDTLKEAMTHQGVQAPGPVSKVVGSAAHAAGGSVLMPGGSILSGGKKFLTAANPIEALKNFAIASGAGAGGELGGDILEGLTKWGARLFTDDKNTQDSVGRVGKNVGNIGGSLAGGYLGAVKANAVGAVLAPPVKMAGQAKEAYAAARAAQQAGDERSLMRIFGDNFGTLSKETNGMIERWVMEQFLDTARKSPVARPLFEAAKADAAKLGKNLDDFTPSQVTADPVIVNQTKAYMPASPEQGEKIARRFEGAKSTLKDAFEKVMGYSVKGDPKTISASLEAVRKETVSKIAFLDKEIEGVAAKLPNPLAVQQKASGVAVREEVEALRGQYLTKSSENYAKAIETDKGFNTAYKLDEPQAGLKDLMNEFRTKMNPTEVPESLRRLGGLMDEAGAGTRNVALKDIDDALQVLNTDIKAASNPLGDQTKARNLLSVKEKLLSVVDNQAPSEVQQLYKEARRFHSEEYGTRFKEKAGAELKRQSRAVPGRPQVPDEAVMDRFVPPGGGKDLESRMIEADHLFGGNPTLGIKRSAEFHDQLQKKVLERFNQEVVGKATQIKDPEKAAAALQKGMDDFLHTYDSAIHRVPDAASRIRDTTQRMSMLQFDKARQLSEFKTLVNSPLMKEFGVEAGDKLLSHAMSDKAKMARLVDKIGPDAVMKEVFNRANPMKGLDFDPEKLWGILNTGKHGQDGPTALQYVFEKQLGAQKGKEHFEQLQAIANLSERIALGDARYVNPRTPFGEGYFQEHLGQSMASILTSGKATMEGRVSPLYSATWMGGRFLNGKVQRAIADAQFDVLFNPEKAKAFYKALETPPGTPVEAEVMAKLFGKSKSELNGFFSRLFETDHMSEILGKSLVFGQTEKKEEKK